MFRFRSTSVGAALIAVLGTVPVAAADEQGPRSRRETSLLTRAIAAPETAGDRSGGFSSDNVEWVGVIPIHTGSSGGKLVGDHYYMTDPRGVYIYDVSDPAAPQLVGELPAAQSSTHAALAQEEPDTNGKILLVNAYNPEGNAGATANGWLLVVDVSDKASPQIVGSLNVYDHTWSCVLDCKFAIGRTGHIVDLRDPTKPEVVADWREHVAQPNYMHDFEEVAPGRVMGAGQPSLYLDMTNPLKPKELARIDPGFHELGYHGAEWPNQGRDPLLLMGAEVGPQEMSDAGSDCNQESVHALATYDATAVVKLDRKQFGPGGSVRNSVALQRQRARTGFRKLQEWRVGGRGAYADGKAVGHTLYCGHWFDPHPDWQAGGVVAIGHYDWGTRFLDVRRSGKIEEVGWFQPIAGYTAAARWITDEIVYVHDYRRGLDILRFTRGSG